jgi:hypothetical protein
MLEYVVVYKQRIANLYWARIPHWERYHLTLSVRKPMVLFVATYDKVSFGVGVSLSLYDELLYCPQKLMLYSIEIGMGAVNSFQSITVSSCSMYMRKLPSLYLIKCT